MNETFSFLKVYEYVPDCNKCFLQVSKPNPIRKKSKKELKAEAKKKAAAGMDSDDDGMKEEDEEIDMPPDNILYKLVDRLEAQLPRDDHVKYDSRYYI